MATTTLSSRQQANFGGLGASRIRHDERFPDPFCDMASLHMPQSIQEANRWCEYIMMANGTYRQAIERVIAYFITDPIISSAKPEKKLGKEEQDKYKTFLNDTLGLKSVLHQVCLDYLTYGNSFTSLMLPFRRYIACGKKGCGFETPLRKAATNDKFGFQWSNFEFTCTCPKCGVRGKWRHIDRRSGEQEEIKVKRWSPHEIEIIWDPYSDKTEYVWKIPEDYRRMIREGDISRLEHATWEVIQAIKHDQDLKFDPGVLFHMKEPALAGMRNRGWGISRILTNFRQAWYVQILHRFNEAIALDYVIPFRVITPQPKQGADGQTADPVHMSNMGAFTARVTRMLRDRRKDPARWNVLPYTLQYQALGGDATQLAPKDLMDQGIDTLLTCIGVPVEFYKGTLSVQAAPAALRLFQANWSHLVQHMNRFVADLVGQISKALQWEQVACKLEQVTHADDLNRQMALLQLMTQGLVSKSKGLRSVGADFEEETRKSLEEERFTAEAQKKMQEEMTQSTIVDEMFPPLPQQMAAAAQGGGGAPPGAAPPGGAPPAGDPAAAGAMPPAGPQTAVDQFIMARQTQPNVPRTVEELNGQAQMIAQDLVSRGPQRQSLLIKLKKVDNTMHSLVTALLEDLDRQMESQGKQQIQQQMAQQQQQMGKAADTQLSRSSDNLLPPLVLPSNPDKDFGRPLRYIDIGL